MKKSSQAQRQRKRRLAESLLLIFLCSCMAVFALSLLPWFGYLKASNSSNNPFNLVALEKMPEEEREKVVRGWVEEYRGLSEDEKAERADQYLNAMIDYAEEKLDLNKAQKAETKGLVKSAVLMANEMGLQDENMPNRDQVAEELANQVREQLDKILTPEQRQQMKVLVEEREQRRREFEERRRQRREAPVNEQ